MKEHTLKEFHQNDRRVSSLINTYEALQEGRGGGRRSAASSDTLRAAVVFIHSSLEEVVRNALLWRLPTGNPIHLSKVPLAGTNNSEKFNLSQLAQLDEHQFVANVIRHSIIEYNNRLNLNHVGDLRSKMQMIEVDSLQFEQFYSGISECIERRHQIVHQMDRNSEIGRGSARVKSISVEKVKRWQANTKDFVVAFVDAIGRGP